MIKCLIHNAIRILGVCLVGAALAGCASTRGGSIPYNVQNFGVPDAPQATVASAEAYKLAPLDTISVTVFQVPDLSHEYVVDMSGVLSLPLVGDVKVLGMSTTDLEKLLEQRLGAKYLQHPDVTVAVKNSALRMVTVDGSVRQPGVYPVLGPLTLIQAVAMAHGADDYANPRRVAIFRQIKGQRMAAAFDLVSIRRGEAQDPAVYPGDTIIIDGSSLRKAQRDLLQSLPFVSIFTPIL